MRFLSSEYPLHQAPSLRCRGLTVDEVEHNFKLTTDLQNQTAPISNSAEGASTPDGKKAGNIGIGTTTSATEKLEVNGNVKATGKVTASDFSLPVGMIMPSAVPSHTTPPIGWLYCNGQTVSRETYANLFAAIGTTYGDGDGSTTFTLPDYRGYFLRAWDDSRGIDNGRNMGSAQVDELKQTTLTTNAHGHNLGLGGDYNTIDNLLKFYDPAVHLPIDPNPIWHSAPLNGAIKERGVGHNSGNGYVPVATATPGLQATVGTGNETRPINISVIYLIKY